MTLTLQSRGGDDHRRGGLRVIGAGFGRSGTTSISQALVLLGYGPCYHMQVTMTRPWQAKFWREARAGKPVDYRRFFRRYGSTVDWPSCEFYRELTAVYPDAKVLLNVRDPDAWYDSMRQTLWAIQSALPWWFPRAVPRMQDEVIWHSRFQRQFADRERAIDIYRAHLDDVRRTVPAERLLEYDVREGWAPLCEFLGTPIPKDMPFPRLNDRVFFSRVLLALRVASWLVPLTLLLGLAWLASTIA